MYLTRQPSSDCTVLSSHCCSVDLSAHEGKHDYRIASYCDVLLHARRIANIGTPFRNFWAGKAALQNDVLLTNQVINELAGLYSVSRNASQSLSVVAHPIRKNFGLLRTYCGQICNRSSSYHRHICLFVYFSLIQKVNSIFAQRFLIL